METHYSRGIYGIYMVLTFNVGGREWRKLDITPNKIFSSRKGLHLVQSLDKRVHRCPQTLQTIARAVDYPSQPSSKTLLLLKIPLTYVIKQRNQAGTQIKTSSLLKIAIRAIQREKLSTVSPSYESCITATCMQVILVQ